MLSSRKIVPVLFICILIHSLPLYSNELSAGSVITVRYETFAENLALLDTGTADNPASVYLAPITFSTANAVPERRIIGWGEINRIIEEAEKYIILDLSDCTASDNRIYGSYDVQNNMNVIQSNPYIKGIVLPSTLETIGDLAFEYCYNLTSIIIPDSVTVIGDWAFSDCGSLTEVYLPNSINYIGNSAFNNCDSLISIHIPKNVTIIERSAFNDCGSLSHVTISEGVTAIGSCAFYNCNNLISVIIPDSVTAIGNDAFAYCKNLVIVTIPAKVTVIREGTFIGCESLIGIGIPYSVTIIEKYVFTGCSHLRDIAVDKANAVYTSENGVLFNKDKTKLIQYPAGKNESRYSVPNTVFVIEEAAFSHCNNLVSVILPNTMNIIEGAAFFGCKNLANINIPQNMTTIYESAFLYCLTSIFDLDISANVTVIDDRAKYLWSPM